MYDVIVFIPHFFKNLFIVITCNELLSKGLIVLCLKTPLSGKRSDIDTRDQDSGFIIYQQSVLVSFKFYSFSCLKYNLHKHPSLE